LIILKDRPDFSGLSFFALFIDPFDRMAFVADKQDEISNLC